VIGRTLGPYEVVAKLGEGGMGEVYRARDTRLGRDVAIKVLGKGFATDEDRLQRFTIEAQTTGALNHPNILAIYDVGTDDGAPYLVAELLEGATLRAKLDEGRLPLSKALDVARQVASGLAAAHARGITHRDIKPENIFITADGRAKILDFGLAKQQAQAAPDETRLQSATAAGIVLGTVGYMSPEQVRGQAADARSDIFSFGVVLYELLSGQRPFKGETAVQTMNAILTEDPPEIVAVGRSLPPALDRVVRHCLEKNPDERFQSARDLAFALDALGSSATGSGITGAVAAVERPRQRRLLPVLTVALALACAGLVARLALRPAETDLSAYRYAPFATAAEDEGRPLWSPDGRMIAYARVVNGRPQVFVRGVEADAPEQLTHDSPGGAPAFWWPDLSRIGFLRTDDQLWAVSRLGGSPELLQEGTFFAATLSPDGSTLAAWRLDRTANKVRATVVVASPPNGPLREYAPAPFAISAALSPTYLRFAPDGRSLLLSTFGADDANPVMWRLPFPDGRADPTQVPLTKVGMSLPVAFDWMPDSRRVVISRSGQLWVLDVGTGAIAPVSAGLTSRTDPSVSPDGARLAFTSGEPNYDLAELPLDGSPMRDVLATSGQEHAGSWVAGGPRLTYVTARDGRVEIRLYSTVEGTDRRIVALPPDAFVVGAVPSPDGRRVVYTQIRPNTGLWIAPISGDEPTKLSTDNLEFGPAWSPDSQRLSTYRNDGGVIRLRIRRVGSSDPPVDLPIDPAGGMPEWSPDASWIAMCQGQGQGILLISPDGSKRRQIAANHVCRVLQWSADGRTIYAPITNASNDTTLLAIDVARDSERVISTLPHGVAVGAPLNPSLRMTLDADGKALLTTIVRSNTDIWTLDR
jgi:eukaryotic-like serine/threonine-protein kinase